MVPATVPVCRATCGVVVDAAGIVNVSVRPPVENWIAGSSKPLDSLDANVRVSVPVKVEG